MSKLHASAPGFLNLGGAMALAADSITHRLDEQAGYRPYFYIKGQDGVPAFLKHGSWDLGDMTGRYLESMVMARQMLGPKDAWQQAEERLLSFLLSLLGDSDLIMDIDKNAPDHMFAQGSALYGLVSYFEDRRDEGVRRQIERLVSGLTRHAVAVDDYVVFPEIATSAPCSHMAGYQIVPLVRFFELTDYEPALQLAQKLSRWAFYHDDTIDAQGVVTRIGWEGHLHAWMDTLAGVVQCSRISGGALGEHRAIVERCKKTYDWVRTTNATAFGWVPDFPTSPTSETCAISSMMRLGLELVAEGYSDYWNDLERFTRNQLIENQFCEIDPVGIRDPRVAACVSGAFDCWAKPNTLFADVRQWGKEDDADIEGCCVNGGMRGIFMAWKNAVRCREGSCQVNLLFDRETPELIVRSLLPHEGRILVIPRKPLAVSVRIPDWTEEMVVGTESAGEIQKPRREGGFVHFGQVPAELPLEVSFIVRALEDSVDAGGQTYQVSWLGDTVVSVEPQGGKYLIYQGRV